MPCEIDTVFHSLARESSAKINETIVRDISEGGVRFRSNQFIPVKDKLLLRLSVPGKKTVEAIAEPQWIREIPSIRQFDIGAKFVSLSNEDREIIRQFVQGFQESL